MRRIRSTLVHALAASLALLFLQPVGAIAASITFHDLTDSVTVTEDTGRATVTCVEEVCTVVLQQPFAEFSGAGYSSPTLNIFDPDGVTLSDTIAIEVAGDGLGHSQTSSRPP